jgi:hypothetical protein
MVGSEGPEMARQLERCTEPRNTQPTREFDLVASKGGRIGPMQ